MCSYQLQALGASGIEEAAVLGDTPTLAGAGRGHEIASFLVTHGRVEHVVPPLFEILHDDDQHFASFVLVGLAGRCVQTDMEHGLTESAADAAIRLLGEGQA